MNIYRGILASGWRTGAHKLYGCAHPWLAVHRQSKRAQGCWSRVEARDLVAKWKREIQPKKEE